MSNFYEAGKAALTSNTQVPRRRMQRRYRLLRLVLRESEGTTMKRNGAQILGRIFGIVLSVSITLLILLLIFAGIKALWLTLF